MKREIKSNDFNYDYTGSNLREQDVIVKGYQHLTGSQLLQAIVNKTFFGDYPMGYKFIADIYENGKTEGINHLGSHDFGTWTIDMEKHVFSLKWTNGWVDTRTRAYKIDDKIDFYDVESGNWRTSFVKCENWEKE